MSVIKGQNWAITLNPLKKTDIINGLQENIDAFGEAEPETIQSIRCLQYAIEIISGRMPIPA